MLRFTLIPLILLVLSIIFGVISYFVYKKIKKGVRATYRKGAEIANAQQKKWLDKEQRKKLPDIVQKGYENFENLQKQQGQLPVKWKILLEPLIVQAKEILDEVTFECIFTIILKTIKSDFV